MKRIKTAGKPKWPLKQPVVMPKKLQDRLYPEKQRPMVSFLKRITIQAYKTGRIQAYEFTKEKS